MIEIVVDLFAMITLFDFASSYMFLYLLNSNEYGSELFGSVD